MMEFQSPLNADGTISVPAQVSGQLEPGKSVRVIIVVDDDPDEDADWERLTMEEFARGCEEDDARE